MVRKLNNSKSTKSNGNTKNTSNLATKKAQLIKELKQYVDLLPEGDVLENVENTLELLEENQRSVSLDEIKEVVKSAELEYQEFERQQNSPQNDMENEEVEEEEEMTEEEAMEKIDNIINNPKKAGNTNKKANNSTKKANNSIKKSNKIMANAETLESKEHEVFKNILDIEGFGKLELRNKKYTTMESIYEAVENEEKDLYIAQHWTPEQIGEYSYNNETLSDKTITGFPYDLDLYQIFFVAPSGKGLYGMSQYSQRLTLVRDNELEEIKGVRYSNSADYQIYEKIEDYE